jgi:regulatory protein RepA
MSKTDPLAEVKSEAAAADEAARTNFLVGSEKSRPKLEDLTGVPYRAPMIIEGYLPQDAGGDVAPGGTGKSTLMIYEAVHVILGLELYGRRIERQGGALFITAEDNRATVFGRLNDICRAMCLTPKQLKTVREGFHVEDVSAMPAKLVRANSYGAEREPFCDEIVEKYAEENLAMVVLDPVSLLGPGETSGNDGMAELMRTARMLAQELGAAVRLVHHVSQQVARSETRDQYAGRGGTAFADNSRGNRQITVQRKRKFEHEGGSYELPPEVRDEDIAKGRVIAIFVHKISYHERDNTPIVVVRKGFAYKHVPMARLDTSPVAEMAREEARRTRILDYITMRLSEGIKITRMELEEKHLEELALTRNQVRESRNWLLGMGLLLERPLPKSEQVTKRKKYLSVVG